MKTATILILPNKYKTETSAIKGDKIINSLGIAKERTKVGLTLLAEHALPEQAKDLGSDIDIRFVGEDDIPRKVTTDLVIILDRKNFIPPNYLERVFCASTLFSSAILCGPVLHQVNGALHDWFKEDIATFYRSYEVPMHSTNALDITEDKNFYPNLHNTIFSGEIYNEIGGYSSLKGNRVGTIWDNRLMLSESAKLGKIIYCKDLMVKYVFNSEELDHNAMIKYFYKCGFLDAIIHSDEDIEDVIWQKYVNNSERFDYSMPIWVAVKDSIPHEKKKEYAHKLAAFRTIYNLGFFEGVEGVSLI
jgi:hypothetical protein